MSSFHTMNKRKLCIATTQRDNSSTQSLTTDTTFRHHFTPGALDNQMLTDLNNNNNVKAKYGNKLEAINKIKSTTYPENDAFRQNKLPKIGRKAHETPLSSNAASTSTKRSRGALACPSNNGTFFNEKSKSFYSKPIKQTNSNNNKLVINKVLEEPVEVLTNTDKENKHIELEAIHLQLSHKSSPTTKAVLTDTLNSSRIKTLSKLPEIERASTDPHSQNNQNRVTVQKEISKALKDSIIAPFYGQDEEKLVTTVRLNELQKLALKGKDIVAKSAQINNSLQLTRSMFEEPECNSVEIEEIRSKTPRGKDNDINHSNRGGNHSNNDINHSNRGGGQLQDRRHHDYTNSANNAYKSTRMSMAVPRVPSVDPKPLPDFCNKSRTGSLFYKRLSEMMSQGGHRKSISNQPLKRSVKDLAIKYDNSYRLDPVVGYVYKWAVGKLLVDYVTNSILKNYKYSCTPVEHKNVTGSSASLKCQDICQMIVRRIQAFDFRRYRYVCHATLTSLKGQGVFIADRQLLSRPYDYTYSYTLEGGSFRKTQWVAVVSLWAIYLD